MGQPSLRVTILRVVMDAKIAGRKTEAAQPLDQFILRHNAGAASRQLTVHPLEDIDVPPGLTQREPAERRSHQPPMITARFGAPVNPASIFPFTVYPIYESQQFWRNPHGTHHARLPAEKKDSAVAGRHCRRVRM